MTQNNSLWCAGAVLGTLLLAAAGCLRPPLEIEQEQKLVNFSHLEHLTEQVTLNGVSVNIVHIYANAPDYKWVEAKDGEVEGIACVDDAARAAVVYMRNFEVTQDSSSLDRAHMLLRFVEQMQADDGSFYNFIYKDNSVNRTGRTSFNSFGWWASRAIWAFGMASRIFAPIDSSYAVRLEKRIRRSFHLLDDTLARYPQVHEVRGFVVPDWLLYGSGADASAELLMGLVEYYRATQDKDVVPRIERLAEGMIAMQDGGVNRAPYGLHRSWETLWHMWGNSQTQALAMAGMALKNRRWISSAEREAVGFYSRLLIGGYLKEFDVATPEDVRRFEQIAYGIRPMSVGLVRLYEATGKPEYLKMAGLNASWLLGNNVLKQPMYDLRTGRCYDGIKDSLTLNKNSGAESTIEALMTLLEMPAYPVAAGYLNYVTVQTVTSGANPFAEFMNPSGDRLRLTLHTRDNRLEIIELPAIHGLPK